MRAFFVWKHVYLSPGVLISSDTVVRLNIPNCKPFRPTIKLAGSDQPREIEAIVKLTYDAQVHTNILHAYSCLYYMHLYYYVRCMRRHECADMIHYKNPYLIDVCLCLDDMTEQGASRGCSCRPDKHGLASKNHSGFKSIGQFTIRMASIDK